MEVDGFSCGACERNFLTKCSRTNHRKETHRGSFKESQGKCGCCSEVYQDFFGFYDHFTQTHADMFHTIVTNDARRFGGVFKTTPAVLLCDYFLDLDTDLEIKSKWKPIVRHEIIGIKAPIVPLNDAPRSQDSPFDTCKPHPPLNRKGISPTSLSREIREGSPTDPSHSAIEHGQWSTEPEAAIGNFEADPIAYEDTNSTMDSSVSQLNGVIKKEEIEDEVEFLGVNLDGTHPQCLSPRAILDHDPIGVPQSTATAATQNKAIPKLRERDGVIDTSQTFALADKSATAVLAGEVTAVPESPWKPLSIMRKNVARDRDPDIDQPIPAYWTGNASRICPRCGIFTVTGHMSRQHFLKMHYPIYYNKAVLRIANKRLRNLERFVGFCLGARQGSRICEHCPVMERGRAELLVHLKESHHEAFDEFRTEYEKRRSKCPQPPEDDIHYLLQC